MTIDQLRAALTVVIDIMKATETGSYREICLRTVALECEIFDAMNRIESKQILDKYLEEDIK